MKDNNGSRYTLPITVILVLPAACWFLLVVLRWFHITEEFRVLESTLEGTGAALVRGVLLFVVSPLIGAVVGVAAYRAGDRRRTVAASAVSSVLLAIANIVTRNSGL
jgi:hypothetical protein